MEKCSAVVAVQSVCNYYYMCVCVCMCVGVGECQRRSKTMAKSANLAIDDAFSLSSSRGREQRVRAGREGAAWRSTRTSMAQKRQGRARCI